MAAKYPHMTQSEARRWDVYLDKYGLPEGKISYDEHLGEGAPIALDWPTWMALMVKALSTHRVDVVVERPNEVLLIEVKGIAGMGAVGQLLGYEALWLRERGVDRVVRLVLVCERCEADMFEVFKYYEIEVIVLGDVA